MSYCTQDDLISRFGEAELIDATDRDSAGDIDPAVIDEAIVDADADINRHLRGMYKLPVSNSAELVRVACDIARFYLWGVAAPEHVQSRYDAAMDMLKGIAKGVTVLDADPPDSGETGPSAPAVVAPDRVFTADTLAKVTMV